MEILRPSTALEHWLRVRSSAPVITYYADDGARIELSGATAANAVSKAVNLFTHELLLGEGDVVWLDLPASHWQAPVLAIAAWAAGLRLALGPQAPAGAAATLGTGAGAAAGVALAVSMHPWGMPLGAATPPGWEDLAAISRIQPDQAWLRWTPAEEVWLEDAAAGPLSGEHLLRSAADLQAAWSLPIGGRLLTQRPIATYGGLLACTLVPAVAQATVILATITEATGILRQEGNAVRALDV